MRKRLAPLALVSLSLACPQPSEDEGTSDEASTTDSESVDVSDTSSDTETSSDTDSDTGESTTGLAAQGFAWVDPG
ncbi:MAG: hypothetical protein KC431_12160, partial [Myxococcales bacterium]|nr:hypothetical protein [Myxococcales bacterium]